MPSAVRAGLWQGGRLTLLPALPGALRSEAHAINDLGLVVGDVESEDGTNYAVLWMVKP